MAGSGCCTSLNKFLTLGILVCAAGCILSGVIDLVMSLPSGLPWVAFTSWIIHVYVIFFSTLLATSMLIKSTTLFNLFGFLRYASGAGLFLMLIGSLTIGWANWVGWIAGISSMVWGLLSLLVHCFAKGASPPTTEPLLLPAV